MSVSIQLSLKSFTSYPWMIFFCCLSLTVIAEAILPNWDRKSLLGKMSSHYGQSAGARTKAWFALMERAKGLPEKEKLTAVNQFFNQFRFLNDSMMWGESNYWASPLEFIGAKGGDCEDFVIAKYFTLRKLGVDDSKLLITMVSATEVNQYHMVLSYYASPKAVPLVLDNLKKTIQPASKRGDLVPVYSFNASSLWLNKQKGRGEQVGSSSRLKKWTELTSRLGTKNLRRPKLKLE